MDSFSDSELYFTSQFNLKSSMDANPTLELPSDIVLDYTRGDLGLEFAPIDCSTTDFQLAGALPPQEEEVYMFGGEIPITVNQVTEAPINQSELLQQLVEVGLIVPLPQQQEQQYHSSVVFNDQGNAVQYSDLHPGDAFHHTSTNDMLAPSTESASSKIIIDDDDSEPKKKTRKRKSTSNLKKQTTKKSKVDSQPAPSPPPIILPLPISMGSTMFLKKQPLPFQRKLVPTEQRPMMPQKLVVKWLFSEGPIQVSVFICDESGIDLPDQNILGGPKTVIASQKQTSAPFSSLQIYKQSWPNKWRLCFRYVMSQCIDMSSL